jgi:hypothetical protein
MIGLPIGKGPGCPVFLAFDCPDHGHRVQGGPPGRRMRSATPTLDPAAAHLGSAPTRGRGQSSNIIHTGQVATPRAQGLIDAGIRTRSHSAVD